MLKQQDIGQDPLESMNVLKAVQWCIRAWDEVTAQTITSCWSHSKINLTPSPIPVEDEGMSELRQQLLHLQQSNRVRQIMDINSLLNLPEEVVVDTADDLDNHIIDLCSPVDEQESDDEAVEVLPQVPPQQVLRLLQSIKLGEMQSSNCNADYIRWLERYEKVVKQRHLEGLQQANIQSFFGAAGTSEASLM